ncbi:type I DNA topoisomerase, partial [Candidatus Aerophobetes bacterium]|nr:type I DNA topoisomerase [Candidatus Aerophobetes bacterium]
MAKNLVIVESPAKAKTINRFLGKEFQVESCFGHIKDLPKSKLGIDIDNEFKPTYEIIPGKKKIVNKLKKISEEMEKVFLATDLDREGEAISWHLSQELNHKEQCRITFNQVTKKALREAIKKPGKIDLNKVDAQQGRRVLDRLVGYKISPLLWEKVKRGLSAGRVQSVAVRLLCEREKQIEEFSPQEYWSISGEFKDPEKNLFKADLYQIDKEKVKISNEEKVREIVKKIVGNRYQVSDIKEEKKEKSPYPPFTTSTLQQAASYHLRFSPAKTMKIAQDLYEGQEIGEKERVGLITYMRSDSVRVAKEAQLQARDWIKKNLGKEYVPTKIFQYKNKKTSQDAHEAIRPVYIGRTPQSLKNYLSPEHYELYDLIWRRFLASQMANAILIHTILDIKGGSFLFRSEGEKLEFPGFLKIYQEKKRKEKIVPLVKIGTFLKIKEIISCQHFTQPPPHYTEAALVKVLEEKGIGRPSTYAPTIFTIQHRGYVNWVKGKLIPTPLARIVNELLVNNFSTILDPKFTAQMEEGLDEVEQGEKKWTVLVKDFYKNFEEDLAWAEKKMRNIKKDGLETTSKRCEKCGGKMVVKVSRFGQFLACSNYPKCKNIHPLDKKIGMKCPMGCGGEIVEKISEKGRIFYACNRYPKCKFISWDEPVAEECPYCKNSYLIKIKDGLKCPSCGKKVEDKITEIIELNGMIHKIVKLREK